MMIRPVIRKASQVQVVLALVCASMFTFSSAFCTEVSEEEKKKPTREELFAPSSVEKLSLTYGHLIQKSMNTPLVKMDMKAVIQGMHDSQDAKPAPMTDKEYEDAIALIQQYAFEDMTANNLKEAEQFLEQNAKTANIVLLEDGKVQYIVTKEGTGDVLTEEMVPTINYTATYSNGTKLGSSEQQGGPIAVPIKDTIPGFRLGVLGMKVGEKRKIFVHPELAYGAAGPLPNGLLIFEIEMASMAQKSDSQEGEDQDEDGDDMLSDNDDFDDQTDDESDDESLDDSSDESDDVTN